MSNWQHLAETHAPGNQLDFDALMNRMRDELANISSLRGGRMVIYYGSGFLQHPEWPFTHLSIVPEDINGFMNCVHGMQFDKGLSLVLHTPGGQPTAAETIVAYLRSKFKDVEVIVPTYAMSAGTMIALSANSIVMGRQSQLGPIDPLMQTPHGTVSAHAILSQFEWAKTDVSVTPNMAAVWAPVLAALGPSLLQEAINAMNYGISLVTEWLTNWMFKDKDDAVDLAETVAKYLSDAELHGSHGRRLDASTARSMALNVVQLEEDQSLQDAVLGAYHAMTLAFEHTGIAKMMLSSTDNNWLKAYRTQPQQA